MGEARVEVSLVMPSNVLSETLSGLLSGGALMNPSVRTIASITALLIAVLSLSIPARAQSDVAVSKVTDGDTPASRSALEERLQNIERKLLELERRLDRATGRPKEPDSSPSVEP